jgi:hypothetical protein
MVPFVKNHSLVELISSNDWSWEIDGNAPPQNLKDHAVFQKMRWYRLVHPRAWISKHFKAHVGFIQAFKY